MNKKSTAKYFFNIKLLFSAALVCFLLVEGNLWIEDLCLAEKYPERQNNALFWIYDPVLGWKKGVNIGGYFTIRSIRIRNYVKTNAKGLRGKEYSYEKGENVKRIVLLGDSAAAGLEVAEEHLIST